MENLHYSGLNVVLSASNNNLEYVRNKFERVFNREPDFTFFNKLLLTKGQATHHIKNGNVNIFIHGEIYEGLNIIESFFTLNLEKDKINEALSQINGSFIILIVDDRSEEIYIITDRINTKRIYFYKNDSLIILTTNPSYFKNVDSEIDIGGIASYLINGVVYNNNTLFVNIKSFDRACLNKISAGKIISEPYWIYKFTNEYADHSPDTLKKEFADCLLRSVNRRLTSLKPETCFISLSGGYDSRFLLGALRTLKGGYKLRTFSYGMTDKFELGDENIAESLANRCGIKHHFESAYAHDLLKTISLNVKYGFGFSNFCDEVDAWLNMGKLFTQDATSLLFVGDMFYHSCYDIHKIKDKRLPLLTAKVNSWHFIAPLFATLPAANRIKLISAYNEIYQSIIQRLPDSEDYKTIKDFAYLDQRVSHTLMYWREFFQGPFIKVTEPLLDNDVLDFVRKLPNELRYKKSFYKETLHMMFPDLFNIPLAQHIWAFPSWIDEIEKNKQAIFSRIYDKKSRLDKIIPSDTIIYLINNIRKESIQYKTQNIIRIVKKVSGNNDNAMNLLGGLLLNHTYIKRNQLIIRLLILREALEY